MSSSAAEDAFTYLSQFWDLHGVVFMKWFISLPRKGQLQVLNAACPDLPLVLPTQRAELTPSIRLVPELNVEDLLDEEGRGLIRLMYSRAKKAEDCQKTDVSYISGLESHQADGLKSLLPSESVPPYFPNTKLAFVDLSDPEKNIQQLLDNASETLVEETMKRLSNQEIVSVETWIVWQWRSQTLLTFFTHIAHTFESIFLKADVVQENSKVTIGCRVCGSKYANPTKDKQEVATNQQQRKLLACTCNAAFYCCKGHQKEDWKAHKKTCEAIRNVNKIN